MDAIARKITDFSVDLGATYSIYQFYNFGILTIYHIYSCY